MNFLFNKMLHAVVPVPAKVSRTKSPSLECFLTKSFINSSGFELGGQIFVYHDTKDIYRYHYHRLN
jgi:hypothetical protein